MQAVLVGKEQRIVKARNWVPKGSRGEEERTVAF